MTEARLSGNLLLTLTVLGWGFGWPVIKLLLEYWPPLFARGVSGVIAGGLILLVALMRGEDQPRVRRDWFWLGVCSLTNVFAWMGLPTIAMLWLSAGEGALLVYTFPIWVAFFHCLLRRVRPARDLLIAITLSVLGLALLFDAPETVLTVQRSWGFALALGAALLFAIGVVCFQPRLRMSTLVGTGWQILLGCALMVAVSAITEPWGSSEIPGIAWLYLAYMILIPMLLCYLAFFAALKLLDAAWASVFMLLTPVVGVLAGAAVLDEPLGMRQVLAVVLVLSGVLLTLLRRR